MRLAEVPKPVRERARVQILDGLGVGFAANALSVRRQGDRRRGRAGRRRRCTVVGRRERLPVRDAALANGILIHGLDFDDTHLESIVHATAACLPCALSLAEVLDRHGRDLLTAYVAGMEGGDPPRRRGEGRLSPRRLPRDRRRLAFQRRHRRRQAIGPDPGPTGVERRALPPRRSGVQVFLDEGAWTKRFHPGWGAVGGITAAYLARAGFVGPSRPYEGKFGLFQTHLQLQAAKVDVARLGAGLGSRWELRRERR